MVKNGGYQGSHVLNSSNQLVASIYQTMQNTKEYFSLKRENDLLNSENAKLKNLLKSNYLVVPLQEFKKNDTLYKQQYTYISAKIVNSSINKRKNYLTLNVGKNQGLTPDMAVMSPDGIIGIITNVSSNFSSVMSVLHKDFGINCQLKKDRSYGPLIWDGKSYEYCSMIDIPTHARLKKGDTVVTSELSGIFPEGILVGFIEDYERKQGEAFYTAKIKLSTNFKKVNHVYIIKNKFKPERDSLEKISHKQIDG
jgi:rod shape-determining protein MreC